MQDKPAYNYSKLRPRQQRLAREHELLHELCERSDKVFYEPVERIGTLPPEAYKITYKVRSIVEIDEDDEPIYAYEHKVYIKFPPDYPGPTGKPDCKTLTQVWHPNIRFHTEPKGRICVNDKVLGAWHSLDNLVILIGEILQYKNYHAIDTDPYPEDGTVAKWVREFAEPQGIISKTQATDNESLLKPIQENLEPIEEEPKKGGIKIAKRNTKAGTNSNIRINPK